MKEYFESSAKFLKLDITFPYNEMLSEAINVRDRFVEHRSGDSKGWKSLTIHGYGEDKTGTWKDYGYANSVDASNGMHWTSIANACPVTHNFFLTKFPCTKYGRVRFMLLEPRGFINLHTDSKMPLLENITLVLSNPDGNKWCWGDGSPDLIMAPGEAYAMNISYEHSLVNNSNEDRIHMIVTRHDSIQQWKDIINTSAALAGETGRYLELNELP